MSEIEVPLEKVQDDILETAVHGDSRTARAAVSSAFLAVFAAIAALSAGHYANEAMIDQINAANAWNYYQAKGIKMAIAELKESGPGSAATGKVEKYRREQEEISASAKEKQASSERNLARHQRLAAAVTFFQIGIALTAIALLTRRGNFQVLAWISAVAGIVCVVAGFLR